MEVQSWWNYPVHHRKQSSIDLRFLDEYRVGIEDKEVLPSVYEALEFAV